MFTEVTALMKFLFNVLKERKILESPLNGRELRSVLHLYFLLDEITEASTECLRLAKHGSDPDVVAELKTLHSSPSEEMRSQIAFIALNVERILEQFNSLQKRLNIYLPEIPRKTQLRKFQRSALVQWWIKILDDRSDFSAVDFAEQLQHQVQDGINPEFPLREGRLNIIIYAGSTNPEYLSTRRLTAINAGEVSIFELKELRNDLRKIIRNCNLKEVF